MISACMNYGWQVFTALGSTIREKADTIVKLSKVHPEMQTLFLSATSMFMGCSMLVPVKAESRKVRLLKMACGLGFVGFGGLTAFLLGREIFRHPTVSSRLLPVAEKIKACPAGNKLWNSVEDDGEFLVVSRDLGKGGPPAFWTPAARCITINEELSPLQKLSSMLFELCNAKSSTKFLDLDKELVAGSVGLEEYLKKDAGIEYYSQLCHLAVTSDCVKTGAWSVDVDTFTDHMQVFSSQEEHVAHYMHAPEYHPHRLAVTREWLRVGYRPYCASHQDAAVCQVSKKKAS